jgi:protein-S-isoprenylcysteine O-methyltransferase Ste14
MITPSPYALSSQPENREVRSATAPSDDSPGVIAPPPLLYGAAFLVGAVLHSLFPKPILASSLAPGVGVALLSVGAALAVWSRRTMEGANTNVNPSLPATSLVVTGPFRFSRNPMYVARTVLYLGLGLLMNALCVLAVLVPLLLVMQYGVVRREERYMEARFGEAYRQYRSAVPRWV